MSELPQPIAQGESGILWIVTSDLYLGTRLRGIGEASGFSTRIRPRLDPATQFGPSDRVVLDLAAASSAESRKLLSGIIDRVAGYAPHVRVDLLKAARSGGMRAVFTQGQLDSELARWLKA